MLSGNIEFYVEVSEKTEYKSVPFILLIITTLVLSVSLL